METSRKSLKCLGLMNKYQLTTQKSQFGSCVTKLEKLNREAFGRNMKLPYLMDLPTVFRRNLSE